MKLSILTLGCKVNQYESEAMEELFVKAGYELTDEGPADVYIINTCTVTNLSDRKSRQFISRAKKENPNSIIAVTGCYSQVAPEDIKELGDIDVILGTSQRHRIVELCEKAMKDHVKIDLVSELKVGKDFEDLSISENRDKTRTYIKIQEGCNQFCSYCIIPYARGPITSRDEESVLEEVERLAKSGYKEFVLTGIHVASYGKDNQGIPLIELIEKVAKIPGVKRIRLSSLEPNIVDDDFLSRVKALPEFCDHFHLSLQSGSTSVLKRMNRKYTAEGYLEKIKLIRSYYPDAGITTDIIVGFPGESEEEFEETLALVREIGFSKIHIFRYSPRKGTPAATFPDQVAGIVKKERSQRLEELAEKTCDAFKDTLIGKTLEVQFEEVQEGYWTGYSKNYIKVFLESKDNLESEIRNVIIVGKKDDGLFAKLS